MDKANLAEFGRIDQTGDAAPFIRFLDEASAEASFQAYKRRLLELLDVQPGRRVLDVGCGPGDDAREMARIVGPRGRVVGVDNSQAMVAEARRRTEESGLPVEFQVADALALPFAADAFDACRADRSLMHVPDPRRALAEMARVLRPGGRLAVYEVDFETVVLDVDERTPVRTVIRAWCDGLRDGWLGRRVPRLLRELGLKETGVWPHTLMLTPALARPLLGPATVERAVVQGLLSEDAGRAWLQRLDELERSDRFFCTLTGFLTAGRKG
jgi:ubiquinone/menaquinone biosynthesis C-methylase UbiE